MGFRDRMARRGGSKSLQNRHNKGTKKNGSYPTIFIKDKIPEGVGFYRPKEGKHLFDALPWEAGKDMPFGEDMVPVTEEGELNYVLDIFVHLNIGAMNKPYVCPYENFGEPCPICEYMQANRVEKDIWKKIKAAHRVVYLIWSHDSPEDEKKGVQIYETSHFSMEEKIAEISELPRGGGHENFSDPDNGKSIGFTRKGSGKDNTQILGHRLVERERAIPDRILDKTFPLDSIVNMHPSYEEIEKEFRGTLKKLNLIDSDDDNSCDETPFNKDSDDMPDDDVSERHKKSSDKSGGSGDANRRRRPSPDSQRRPDSNGGARRRPQQGSSDRRSSGSQSSTGRTSLRKRTR